MSPIERIKEFALFNKLSISSLEKACGFSNGYLKNTKNMSAEAVMKVIAAYPDLSLTWVMSGEGSMLNEADELECALIQTAKTLPHIPFRAAAGYLGVEAESIDLRDAPHHAQIDFFDRYDMTITVDGMSMYPRFITGDILAIERIARGAANDGGTYVVATREGAVVKVVEQSGDYLRLIPLNKDYPTTQAHWDSVLGLYRIVGMLRTDIP